MALLHPILIGASGAGAADFTVDRSLRFNDDDSPRLTRTLGSEGNRRKWTWSCWFKPSNLGAVQVFLLSQRTNSDNQCHIMLSSDQVDFESGGGKGRVKTQAVFRDVSAWYHLVLHLDSDNSTASDRVKIYINGVQQELTIQTTVATGDHGMNNNNQQQIGAQASTNDLFYDGYLAEINFIDGQAYDPSYFAETDALTGQWNPKKYTGSYGSQGFYLKFSDNSGTTATTLGKDSSGNGNNFTPNNFSVSAGAGNDSLEDTPTNNFCTLSPKLTDTRTDSSFVNGNLSATTGSGASTIGSTFAQTSGKWYAEFVCTAKSSTNMMIGVNSVNGFDGERQNNESQNGGVGYGYINNGNNALPDGSNNSYGASWAIDDVMAIALDLDNNTVNFYKNNSAQGTISIADGYNYTMVFGHGQGGVTCTFDVNFGQRPFTYTPPSGFLAQN